MKPDTVCASGCLSLRMLLIVVVAATSIAGCRPAVNPGQQADVTSQGGEWEIVTGGAFGNIRTVVRCADVLFLADVSNLAVHRYDLATNRLLARFAPGQVGMPWALAVDCPNRDLYVINITPIGGRSGPMVRRFNLDSGELRKDYPLTSDFLPLPGGRVEGASLLVAGIWGPPDREVPAEDYYAGHRLGLRLSLETGVTESLVEPYETGCIGAGACPNVRLDSVVTPQTVLRVVSLPTSAAVGVYEGGELVRVVDVESPRFVRDDDVLPAFSPPVERMRWTERNSIIDRVFAFEDVFAVVHVLRHIAPSWQLGETFPISVFMNTYGWDGTPRLQDVSLPGPAVGSGDGMIYVLDYEEEDWRSGAERVRFVQVPVSE